jgi:RHS repeat-associated protein
MVDSVGTNVYAYTAGGELFTEDGPFANDTVTNTYANRLRVALGLQQPSGAWTNGFMYDAASRLTNVTSQAGAFGYNFALAGVTLPGSMIQGISLPNTAFITNEYDLLARLTSTSLVNSGGHTLDFASYEYNPANQRTNFASGPGTVAYGYDKIGQLKVANSTVSGENRGYAYDPAWNLNYRTNNGVLGTFLLDTKNELTNAPSPMGTITYDSNGNLIGANGQYTYEYDGENRLSMWIYAQLGLSSLTNGDLISTFAYDGLGRLRIRDEYTLNCPNVQAPQPPGGNGGSFPAPPAGCDWVLTSETRYIYDGYRVIQERDSNNVPVVSYTRGTDLSGTLEGAGGIAGLLARSSGYSSGNWTSHAYYHADGGGNITYLVDSSQNLAASYRYDPYGNTVSSSGTLANANVYRFSSKEIHVNSGMYYFLYRFYDPNLQRWINKDPIDERGGLNLYRFCRNNSVTAIDSNGRYVLDDQGFPITRTGTAMDTYISDPNSGNQDSPGNPGSAGSPAGQPNPPNATCPLYGGTFQAGLSLNGQLGPFSGNFTAGFVLDSRGHLGIFHSFFGGGGVGAAFSGGLSFAISNGGTIQDISGPFGNVSASLGAGLDGSIEGFAGPGSQGQPIKGGGFTVAVGGGGGWSLGGSTTSVTPLW